jgi:hypothetical protein
MLTQNSVQESQNKVTTESPCKVLQGNQDLPTVEVRWTQIQRLFNGIQSFDLTLTEIAGILTPPYDLLRGFRDQFKIYKTRTDNWTSAGGSYTGISSTVGPGFCQQSAGYPSSFHNSNPTPPPFIWVPDFTFPNLEYDNGVPPTARGLSAYDGGFGQSISGDTIMQYDNGEESFTSTLSDLRDVAGDFLIMKSDLFSAQPFPLDWSSPLWGYGYNFPAPSADCTGLDPANFDGSLVPIGGGNTPLFAVLGVDVYPQALSGWSINGIPVAYRGQIRYTGAATQAYWVGRYTGTPNHYQIDLLSTGLVIPINGEWIMEAPFPADLPFPIPAFHGEPLVAVFNFIALGNPSGLGFH